MTDREPRTPASVERICRTGIPGYDPWAAAGTRWRFDAERAAAAVEWFPSCLVFIEGARANEPFVLEDWQAAIVGNLFGWVDENGLRRYREAFVGVGRKNGKTPLAAGIALLLLLEDDEPGAQVYSAAADREQASLVYRHAATMALRCSLYADRVKTYRTTKALEVPETLSILRALSSDAETKHGLNVHGAIVDELHAHKNRDLVDVLLSGRGARRQPLVLYITTSDYDRESICNELWDHARKVRDGTAPDARFLPALWEAGANDDWKDPAVWRRANPNLGVSKSLSDMEEECAKAQMLPRYLNAFLRLHLNVRTGSHTAWLPMERWDACAGPTGWEALPESLAGQECYLGLDLAQTSDIAGLCAWFPAARAVVPWGFAPLDNARERAKRDRAPYLEWASSGAITLTEGNVTDYEAIRLRIMECAARYRVKALAFDRWHATDLVQRLQADGVPVFACGQGYGSLSAPAKAVEAMVLTTRGADRLAHGAHPVLRWMASHAMVETDAAGNIKPSKRRSSEKIDLLVALVMAVAASNATVAPTGAPSVFVG